MSMLIELARQVDRPSPAGSWATIRNVSAPPDNDVIAVKRAPAG
jgi:hypothetical protein